MNAYQMGFKRGKVLGMLVITYTNRFDDLNSDDDFDRIQILSSRVENADEFFLAPITGLNKADVLSIDREEAERKRVARVVALVSGLLTFRNLLGLLESAIMLQTSTLEINV